MSQNKVITYVNEELTRRRLRRPHYSLRNFALDMEINVATLSQLLNSKRKLTFDTAYTLLEKLETPPETKKALLISLFDSEISKSALTDKHILNDESFLSLDGWEAFAVHRALEIEAIRTSPAKIAAKIGSTVEKVASILSQLIAEGFVEKKDDAFINKGFNLFSNQHQSNKDILLERMFDRLDKSTEALGSDLSLTDFTSYTFAIHKDRFNDFVKKLKDFAVAFADSSIGDGKDEVAMLNIQLFALKNRTSTSKVEV